MRTLPLLILAACASSPATTPTPARATTTEDPATSGPAAGLVWVDADGQVVEGVAVLPEGLALFDKDGVAWLFDRSRDPMVVEVPLAQVAYRNPDCATEPLLIAAMPRYAYLAYGDADWDGRFVVASDGPQELVMAGYSRPTGDCVSIGEFTGTTDFREVEPPRASWIPPLHPELR